MSDNYGLSYQFGGLLAPSSNPVEDNYGLSYQFGGLLAPSSGPVEDNYGLSYQFGGLLAPSSNPVEDNYGLSYQFGGLLAPSSGPVEDNYGLSYQFGDLTQPITGQRCVTISSRILQRAQGCIQVSNNLNVNIQNCVTVSSKIKDEVVRCVTVSSRILQRAQGCVQVLNNLNVNIQNCVTVSSEIKDEAVRCVTVSSRILQRAQGCITTANRLSQRLRCVTVSNELILYKQRCVTVSGNLLQLTQNCVTVGSQIKQAAQGCVSTRNRLNPVVSCISVSSRIGSTLRCVSVSNRLASNIQRCVESRNKLSARHPVLSCVAVSSAILQQITIRYVAASIPGVPDVPTVFISQKQRSEPNPPPSMPVGVDSTNTIVKLSEPDPPSGGGGGGATVNLKLSPAEVISGDLDPAASGALCITEGFKVFLKAFPGANTDYIEIEYATVSIVADHNSYAYELNLTFLEANAWGKARPFISTVKVTLGVSFEWIFLVENRSRSVARQGANYTVFGRSTTMVLGDRIATRITKDFEGMMLSDVFEELASAQGISVQYDIADVEVGENALSSDNQTPLDIIVSATDTMGGIVRSHPNQQVLIIEYPVDTGVAPVQRELTFVNSVDTLSEQWDWKPSWTSVIVSDEALTSDKDKDKTIKLSQVDDKIRAFTVPFRAIALSDSANPGTDLIFEGEHFEEISETVTIICGEASLSRPFHEIISVKWLREDLGAISVKESGALTTELDGNSLLDITYSTRFQQWGYLMEDDKTLIYANEI